MINMSTVAMTSLAAYLHSAELVDATTAAPARASTVVNQPIERSYARSFTIESTNKSLARAEQSTARSEAAPVIVGPEHAEDSVLGELVGYREIDTGWDGENAAKPIRKAIEQAISFVRASGASGERFIPTLDVDGSVLLEIGSASEGILKFRGDWTIVYTLEGTGVGVAEFNGFTVPDEIRSNLAA